MELGLEGRVALVGGSSRGIGLAIARAFLAEGARVVLTARGEEALHAAACRLGDEFGHDRVLALRADLVDPAAAETVVERVVAQWSRIDALVANAGSGTADGSDAPTLAEWDRVLDVNLRTAVSLTQAVLPRLEQEGGGSITLVGSIAGVESLGAPLPYGAAKAALTAYARDLARRVGARGIRVNCVAPGNVLFPGGSWQRKLDARPEETRRYVEAEVPLRRFGTPEEIADLVVFLASERARFVTGALVVADGGQTRGS